MLPMKRIKELKKQLGGKYFFCRPLSDRDVFLLQRNPPKNFAETVVASLTVGCVKIEATLFKSKEKLKLCYDVFVKDTPDSDEWICYENPTDTVKLRETEMLLVLDRIVSENGLSYTECCFEKLDGKVISPVEKPSE